MVMGEPAEAAELNVSAVLGVREVLVGLVGGKGAKGVKVDQELQRESMVPRGLMVQHKIGFAITV